MRATLSIVLAVMVVAGCTSKNYDRTIRKHGGYNLLRAECTTLSTGVFEGKAIHSSLQSNFPPFISSLRPEIISIYNTNPSVIYINIGGGFSGHGILVVCTNKTFSGKLSVRSYEKITELDPGVYEYLYLD